MAEVLYISYDGLTDPLGQSQIIPYLTRLSSKGHRISIVSCEKPKRYSAYGNSVNELLNDSAIRWFPIKYYSKLSFFAMFINYFKLRNEVFKVFKSSRFDTVHSRSYIPSLFALTLKRKYALRFIFDMRGFWIDERIEGNIWDIRNPFFKIIYNYFKHKEKQFFESADAVVSLTHVAKAEIVNSFEVAEEKITVIPCCVDTHHFSYDAMSTNNQEELKKKLSIRPDDKVISYIGSIGTWYMLNEMMDFFKQLSQAKPQYKFLFITNELKDTIIPIIQSKQIPLEKIIFHQASYRQMPLALSLADISLFFIKPSFSKIASSPVKQAELFSMGIPIICNKNIGDTDKIIQESHAGILIDEFTVGSFDKAIQKIDELLNVSRSQIRKVAIEQFDVNRAVEQYDKLYS